MVGRVSPKYGRSRSEFQLFMPGEREQVTEAFACSHCGRPTKVKPFCDPADVGGLCRKCSGLMCPTCAAKGECDTLEMKLRRQEARGEALRSYGF